MLNDQSYPVDATLMLESMTQSILITSVDFDSPGPYIEYVNKAFEKMTGWKREEVLGKNPRLLQGPKTDLGIFKEMREKLNAGEVWRGRTINYKKDGTTFYMEWSIAPVFDQKGEIYKLLAVQEDVSKIVKTEQKLEDSRKKEILRTKQIETANIELSTLSDHQKKTLDLFIKYVPESIVKKALNEPIEILKNGSQLDAALLFCDIRGFTPLAEELTPKEVVRVLNVYYSMMSDVIKMHNGTVNQFVGDEIFLSFGAPDPIKDPEKAAVLCAIDMINKLDEINAALSDILNEKLVVGIGINYGPIIAGNLGSEDRISYSITGDAVNTAKRIETLTRQMPDTILISESIFQKTKDLVKTKSLGKVEIKGKNSKIEVYQVL